MSAVVDEGDEVHACVHPEGFEGGCSAQGHDERIKWTVFLFPGYSYAHLLALQDDSCMFSHASGRAVLDKDYARVAFYFVLNISQCPRPAIETETYTSLGFDTYVRVNPDATAQMAGLTRVIGPNTGLDAIVKAGCEVGMDADEAAGSLEVSLGGATIKIPIVYGGDDDYATDGDAIAAVAKAPVVDEEWILVNHVDGRVTADADALDEWADARAILLNHNVFLGTKCLCKGACKRGVLVLTTIDDTTEGVKEVPWTVYADTGRLRLPGE